MDVPAILSLRAAYLAQYPGTQAVERDGLRWMVAGPVNGRVSAVIAYEDFPAFRYASHFFIAPGHRAMVDAIRISRWIVLRSGADGLLLTFAVDARNATFLAAVEATRLFEQFDYDPVDGRYFFRRRVG